MEVENRGWGRPSPVDLLPLVGLAYRLYWVWVARRGLGSGEEVGRWRVAVRGETERALFSAVFTVAAVVFVLAGADHSAAKPALLVALVGVMLHRFAVAVGAVRPRAP